MIPDQSVVTDINVITSFCPQTAPHVAIALLGMLMGDEKARVVATAMGYEYSLEDVEECLYKDGDMSGCRKITLCIWIK